MEQGGSFGDEAVPQPLVIGRKVAEFSQDAAELVEIDGCLFCNTKRSDENDNRREDEQSNVCPTVVAGHDVFQVLHGQIPVGKYPKGHAHLLHSN